ncbi:A-factor biosynthesis hotdog domain-containing protein [Allokutzneria albata]|uniref:A-factor biosynthesis hotdog domain-containing protein n=1 Tax=Allokutzneria albata TaxID=211114 RepID=A0A1G9QX14_ALLAB|nr:A-factor biosynthesis hotdog domain-containing protein [Allokutzneria albata]
MLGCRCGVLQSIPDPPSPLFHSTVDRRLVHRAAVHEVLLTGWARTAGDRYMIGAQWPRDHSFYRPVPPGAHDPLLVLETVRQAGLLVAHVGADVPVGHHFVMHAIGYDVDPRLLRLEPVPADLTIDVTYQVHGRRPTGAVKLGIRTLMARDGEVLGSGFGEMTCLPETVYRNLRARSLPPGGAGELATLHPVEAHRVNRLRAADVVLSPGAGPLTWLLRVDRGHPVLFDHPLDHVPGMLVFEAMRQALAYTGRGLLPLGCHAELTRYVELDPPAAVVLRPGGGDPVFDLEQGGKTAGTVSWFMSPGGGWRVPNPR